MFVGAVIAHIAAAKLPDMAGTYTIPLASGLIAGESLMGVLVALLSALGLMK
jgi:uncharacterized oligopeptide transporter (OPT) family protein